MAKNYPELAFTSPVKELQEKLGSRTSYARMERDNYVEGFTKNEISFIEQRDSFYIASIGENDFPYIQHRGGPKGFVKVLDKKQIGFIDFSGNMQYISVGNVATNNKVALIMVDYTAKARLKILAKLEIVELKDDRALYDLLNLNEYRFKPERMMRLHVEAYDWNCPQHITPRYTEEEFEVEFVEQKAYILKLEDEVKELKQKLK